ncbi:hypothetical protein TMEC54S_03537 [Thauera mechernichensis]
MTLDRRSPVPLFGRVVSFGPSLHGRVQNGVLTLDNGMTVPHMQPISQEGMPWTAASTYYVRRPGWAPAPIASSVRDSMAAQGRELLEYAILAGADRMYARKPTDGSWLAFDDEGRCWSYRMAGRSGPNTARVFTLRRRRFGLVDGSGIQADTILTTAAIDMGQSGAPDYYYQSHANPSAPGVLAVLPDTYNPVPILVLTTPDGRRSLWMLAVRSNGPGSLSWRSYIDHPVAFFELLVAADGSVTAQLVKSRADCMGAYAGSFVTTSTGGTGSMVLRAVTLGGESCGVDGSREFGVWEAVTDVDDRGPAVRFNDYAGGSEWSQDWAGIVLAAWYDTTGAMHTITADIEYRFVRVTSAGYVGGSSTVDYRGPCSDGSSGATYTGTVNIEHNVNYDVTERTSVTIRDNGVAVPGLSHTVERHSEAAQSIWLRWFPPANPTGGQTATMSGTISVDGEVIGSSAADVSADWNRRNDQTSGSSSSWSISSTHRRSPPMVFPLMQGLVGATLGNIGVEPVRWSNHAVGLRTSQPIGVPWEFARDEFGSVLTPGGVIAHTLTLPDYAIGTRYALSGSWRPVRNQFATSVTVDDGVTPHTPVCWV